MKFLAFVLCFSFSVAALAVPQTNSITITAGRGFGLSKTHIYNAAQSCGVTLSAIDVESHIVSRTFFVTYTGEYQNAVCFYNWVQRISGNLKTP